MRRQLLIGAGIALATGLAARAVRHMRAYDFKDKTVFITGGSRGLGLAIAREAAKRGARVAICGRDTSTLETAADDLRSRGATVLAIPCDVRADAQLAMAVRRTQERFGAIDVAIH